MRLVSTLGVAVLLAVPILGQDIEVRSGARPFNIYLQKEITLDYYLVTKDEPCVCEVEGPADCSFYSRYVSRDEIGKDAVYKYILQEDEARERIVSHVTDPSTKSRADEHSVAKWRSTLLEVPPGDHTYRIILWDVTSGEVAFKISPSTPTEWVDVAPLGSPDELVVPEDERLVTYSMLESGSSLRIRVEGDTRMKFVVRLNFDQTMDAEAGFTLEVQENGKSVDRRSYRTYRSETATYRNLGTLIPSRAEVDYLDVPDGEHVYEFRLSGTLAGSASIRFLVPK
jgi:hypothetical protein